MSASAQPFGQYANDLSSSTPSDFGIDTTDTTLTSPSSGGAATAVGVSDVLSSLGNFALGAFALSKLPANRIPVPAINTPTPLSTGATAVAKQYGGIILIGLLLVGAVVLYMLFRKRG